MQQALEIRDFEIERRLEAFARARLNPDHAVVARTRARVMREARLQFQGAAAPAVVPMSIAGGRRPLARRLAMPLLAASVWIGIAVGSVAASGAGGPLYPTRLWVENALLPSAIADRTTAEIARLDTRLGDALSAAARGDTGAVAAAIDAYRQIADDALAATTGDEPLETLIGAALARHQAVLASVAASLEAKGSATAADAVETALQRAIDHNAAVVARLAETGGRNGAGTPGSSTGGTGGRTGSGSGGASSGSGGSGDGATGGGGGNGGSDQGATGGTGGSDQGGTGNAGNGQDGGKPSKEPKPTPDSTDPGRSAPPIPGDGQNQGGAGQGSQH